MKILKNFILPWKLPQELHKLVKKLTLIMKFPKKKITTDWTWTWDELHKQYIYWWNQCWIILSNSIKFFIDWTFNKSGTACIEENTAMKIPPPEIQRVQNFNEEIKSACAKTLSSWFIWYKFLLIRQELWCKLFVINFNSINTTCPKRSS